MFLLFVTLNRFWNKSFSFVILMRLLFLKVLVIVIDSHESVETEDSSSFLALSMFEKP